MSWWSPESLFGACRRRKRAQRSLGPSMPRAADIPALTAEVESAWLVLKTAAARLILRGGERPLLLEEVETLLESGTLVVDACRNVVRNAGTVVSLATRPVLFTLARALGEAWPGDVPRSALLARAFRAKHADESRSRTAAGRDGPASGGTSDACGREGDEARLCAGAAPRPRGRRSGSARRRTACGGARLPCRRRVLVEFCSGDCAWSQPAHGTAGARTACGSRQGTVGRSWKGTPLDDPARAWIPDNLVTPRSAAK